MYCFIKKGPVLEEYLLIYTSNKNIIIMCKFCLGNHKLPIVKGKIP